MPDDVTDHASDSPLLSAIDSDAATGTSPGDVSPATPAADLKDAEADVNDATPAAIAAAAAPVVEVSRGDALKARAAELAGVIAMIGNPYAERDALNQQIRKEIADLEAHTKSATVKIGRLRDRFRAVEEKAGQDADVLRVARLELAQVEHQLSDVAAPASR